MKHSAFTVSLAAVVAFAARGDCTGWAGFAAPATYTSSAAQVVLAADLDGDGDTDLIASGNQVEQLATFSLFANRGDGTFAPERLIATGLGERMQDIADLNGDGVLDLIASQYWSNGIVIHLGRGSLSFDSGTSYATATHGGPTLGTDVDGDGRLDVISLSFGSGNPVRLHLFPVNRDGTLAAKTTLETGLANGASPSIRFSGRALEILVSERSGNLGLLRYLNGTLSVSRIPAGPGFDLAGRFADVNGDGIADIIDTNDAAGVDESIFVTLGNAKGSFGERRQIARPRHMTLPVDVRAADLDGDGRIDLVASDFQESSLYWFRGDGAGEFAEGVAIDAGGPVNAFAVADLNGDGRADLVTVNNDHTISVLLNRGPCGAPRRRAVRH